jgi:prevent-host-death family protein
MTETVGIRELRQNLSDYVHKSKQGKCYVVTERSKPVAMLTPLQSEDDAWERLIAEGRISPPTNDLLSIIRPVELDDPYAGTRALEEQREERLR